MAHNSVIAITETFISDIYVCEWFLGCKIHFLFWVCVKFKKFCYTIVDQKTVKSGPWAEGEGFVCRSGVLGEKIWKLTSLSGNSLYFFTSSTKKQGKACKVVM